MSHGRHSNMLCIICNRDSVLKSEYAACHLCSKSAARKAARYYLKQEAARDGRLYDEEFQRVRLKTLVNRYEKTIKRRLKKLRTGMRQ